MQQSLRSPELDPSEALSGLSLPPPSAPSSPPQGVTTRPQDLMRTRANQLLPCAAEKPRQAGLTQHIIQLRPSRAGSSEARTARLSSVLSSLPPALSPKPLAWLSSTCPSSPQCNTGCKRAGLLSVCSELYPWYGEQEDRKSVV